MGEWDQNGSWGDSLGEVESIQVAQDRGQWWAVVNSVMNLWDPAPRSELATNILLLVWSLILNAIKLVLSVHT
jgi:hypothetical protein